MGTTVSATSREHSRAKPMVYENSLKMVAAIPARKHGRNTAIFVMVAANTGMVTSFVPTWMLPERRCLHPVSVDVLHDDDGVVYKHTDSYSQTLRERTFMVRPVKYITMNVATIDVGMEIAIIIVEAMFLRNRKQIKTASTQPMIAVSATLAMECFM
jgi:hypothetical protein